MSDPWNPDSPDNCAVCGAALPRGMREVYDAAMMLEEEQAKHGTDAFSQDRFDQLATALIHACRRAKEGR